MFTTISAKYEVDEDFRNVLMADRYKGLTFVEASPFDAVWGIKTSATKKVLAEGEVKNIISNTIRLFGRAEQRLCYRRKGPWGEGRNDPLS